ncbi:MAG: hypothetical protein ACT4OY_04310 [Alphaproteobacteria bacterium]
MSNETILGRFHILIAFVVQATGRVEAGKSVDLANLNREVDRFCEDAKKADPAMMPDIKILMAELISRLDDLSLRLVETKQKYTNGH